MSSTTVSPKSSTDSGRSFTTSSISAPSDVEWSSSEASVSDAALAAGSDSDTAASTPPVPTGVAQQVFETYLTSPHADMPFRGLDPKDSEGETMDDFMGWCARGARRHQIAVLGDRMAQHDAALDTLYDRKELRRAMCEEICGLRQVCLPFRLCSRSCSPIRVRANGSATSSLWS